MGFGHGGGVVVVRWFPDQTVRQNRVFYMFVFESHVSDMCLFH